MRAYERLQPSGVSDNVELGDVQSHDASPSPAERSTISWFPTEGPPVHWQDHDTWQPVSMEILIRGAS